MAEAFMSDDAAEAAKEALQRAIEAYYDTVDPGTLVDAWLLVAHKQSIRLEREGQTSVSYLVKTGQPFVMSMGLAEVARDAASGDSGVWEEEG